MSGRAGVIGVVSSIFSAMAKPCWEKCGNAKEKQSNNQSRDVSKRKSGAELRLAEMGIEMELNCLERRGDGKAEMGIEMELNCLERRGDGRAKTGPAKAKQRGARQLAAKQGQSRDK